MIFGKDNRYTALNNCTVLVDPRTHHIVQIIEYLIAAGLTRPVRRRCTKTGPYEASRSLMRYRGAWSHGKASVIWREIHSAVGFAVTPNDTQSRRPCRMITRQ